MTRHRSPRASSRFWPARPTTRSRRFTAVCGAAALLAVGCWKPAFANFAGHSSVPSGTLAAGSVSLSNSSSQSLVFAASGLQPGASQTSCVDVQYTGSLNAQITLQGATTPAGPSALGGYLSWTVQMGTGNCASFSPVGSPLFNALAYTLPTTAASAIPAWTAVGGVTSARAFRITYTVAAKNAAAGLTCDIALTWAARDTVSP